MARKADEGMKIQIILIGWACMTVCLVSYTAAFSHGASLAACHDMRPKHIRAQPQNPKKNYVTIYTNRSFYLPGDRVPVTVRSTRDFMGFMLQARMASNDHIAGTFVFIPPGTKQLGCSRDGDAVTHSDKSLKRNLSFVWRAPDKPTGDIKFCLSVVQSYFVYWPRIESAIVLDLAKNRNLSLHEEHTSVVIPTQLTSPFTVKGNISGDQVSVTLNMTLAEDTKPVLESRAAAVTGESLGQPYTSAFNGGSGMNAQHSGRNLSKLLGELATPSARTRGQNIRMLNKSDQIWRVQEDMSRPNTSQRTEHLSRVSAAPLCSTCGKDTPVFSEAANTAVTISDTNNGLPPSSLLGDTSWPPPTGKSLQLSHKHNESVRFTQPSTKERVEGQPVTKKISADFLQQSEQAEPGQEAGGEAGHTPPWMTKPVREPAVPAKGGENSRRGMHLAAAQLGILLGCSAALGMALAAGLRCIHAQYCHKRTEVSFSEPETNVITVRESGEMMEFRKVRENSFVLVQAEYNWITPSANGKKQ
ncbi:reelin domain-containing protein 1 [Ambystoma mexicanum]|uniref:reelin domain-containing protein 1 n=1 Tax=Ambystoma mexicanum TaxID=8296 RepID=UPI0037E8D182